GRRSTWLAWARRRAVEDLELGDPLLVGADVGADPRGGIRDPPVVHDPYGELLAELEQERRARPDHVADGGHHLEHLLLGGADDHQDAGGPSFVAGGGPAGHPGSVPRPPLPPQASIRRSRGLLSVTALG